MLSSRLKAFARPISQTTAIASPITLVVDELDVRPGGEHDRRGGALRGELRERRQAAQVVDEPGGEDERDRRRRCRRAPCRGRTRRPRRRAQSPALKPAKMPMPPKLGVGASCQRSAEGTATSRLAAGDRSSAQITAAAAGRATIATVVLTAR